MVTLNRRTAITFFIIISIFSILIFTNAFSHIRNSMTDRLYGGGKALDSIIIVTIDDDSINKIGRWPWNRDVFAQILNKVRDARVVGVDVSFFEESQSDDLLNKTLGEMDNVVLAAEINEDTLYKPIFNIKLGYVNFVTDGDGVTRSIQPGLHTEVVPFSFEIYKKGWDKKAEFTDRREYINFVGEPGSFTSIKAHDLLQSNMSFKGKFVLIGATAPNLHDNYFVPTSNGIAMPGVEIHANTLQNLILNNFIVRESALLMLFGVIIACLGGILVFSRLKVYYSLLFLLGIIGIYFYAGILLFSHFHYLLDLFFFPLTLIISIGAGIGLIYLEEKKHNVYITDAFGKYISKDLLHEIVHMRHELKLGGVKREITVFFSDVRGFTSISEKLSPEELVSFMNEYLTEMTKIILKHKGTVDKFIGDAIMALWNAPIEEKDHAKLACESAIEQARAVHELRKKFAAKNLPELNIGCGINTGEAIIGNMGSHDRFDYTAIGDSVNLASRLESLTKDYGVDIIVSEYTYEKVKEHFKFRMLDKVKVKGKKIPVTIYELCTKYDETFAKQFSKALDLYFARDFSASKKEFEKAEKMSKEDKACEMFIARCGEYAMNSPGEEWDGAFERKTK